MKNAARLPKARTDNLVIRELDDETLVYDMERDEAHSTKRPRSFGSDAMGRPPRHKPRGNCEKSWRRPLIPISYGWQLSSCSDFIWSMFQASRHPFRVVI
jgi:hypothetical protein